MLTQRKGVSDQVVRAGYLGVWPLKVDGHGAGFQIHKERIGLAYCQSVHGNICLAEKNIVCAIDFSTRKLKVCGKFVLVLGGPGLYENVRGGQRKASVRPKASERVP